MALPIGKDDSESIRNAITLIVQYFESKKQEVKMMPKKMVEYLYLDMDVFDPKHSREFPGGKEMRGGFPYYIPSSAYYREALRVQGKYDNGDDSWLKMDGKNNWAIAFHGLRFKPRDTVSKITSGGFIVG